MSLLQSFGRSKHFFFTPWAQRLQVALIPPRLAPNRLNFADQVLSLANSNYLACINLDVTRIANNTNTIMRKLTVATTKQTRKRQQRGRWFELLIRSRRHETMYPATFRGSDQIDALAC